VRLVTVEQAVDPFLEARRLASASSLAAATTNRELLDRVQGLFPVQGPGIGNAIDEFFASANALATHPQDLAARTDFLGRAEALAAQLRDAASGVATLQRETDGRIVQATREASELLTTVAQLNRAIVAAEVGGNTANELRDARREALGELAQAFDVQVLEIEDGSVSVFTASGVPLVVDGTAATLVTNATGPVGLDGLPRTEIAVQDAGGGVITLAGNLGGKIGALTTLRDQGLPATAADLDLLATTLRDAANAVQTDPAGRDLDGLVGTALFAGSGAGDLTVALTDPRGIAAARTANPGDNGGALAMAALATTTFPALGGITLGDFYGTVQAEAGNQARGAEDRATIEENVAQALAAQREAVSGVSLEEEFTDLIRFQRAFQAASQLIVTSNRMLDDLLNMVR
jgi:flagellar hook-associated protein 1 FlgK